MERQDRIREHLKTALVTVLMVMLVCLCIIYMVSYQNTGQYAFTADTMKTIGGQSVKYQYADHFDFSYAAPKFIGASAERFGKPIGFFSLGGANESAARSILPFYEKLFSAEAEMTPLSREEGRALFHELLTGDHLYVAYENDLPRSVLYALSMENAMLPAVSGEYLREIIIAPSAFLYRGVNTLPFGTRLLTDNYAFYAVARDSAGNYYRYTTDFVPEEETDICFNTNYYLSYTEMESRFDYELAETMEKDDFFLRYGFGGLVAENTIILNDTAALPADHVSVTAQSPKTDRIYALLWTLLVNPEQVTSFTDAEGVRFYYDGGKNISITPQGRFSYAAHGEEGLPLSSLFEYQASGERYDMTDYVGASLMLLRSLENAADTENPASLYLSGIQSDGTTLTVTFGYALHGFPIYLNGQKSICTMKFEAGMLKELTYDIVVLRAVKGETPALDVKYLLREEILRGEKKKAYGYGYIPETGRLVGVSFVCFE